MNRSILLPFLLVLGCSTEPSLAQGMAWPDCAPWDGAATRIVMPLDSASNTTLALALYQGPEQVRGHSWTIDEHSGDKLSVTLCRSGGGGCVTAREGWVRVQPGEPGSELRGQYRVILGDGRVLAGRFVAPIQPRTMLCG
jgi:hypothetical protein